MVNIEGIDVETLHTKLKVKRVERLVREVFGKSIDIDEFANSLHLREKPKHMPKNLFYSMLGLGILKSKSFLVVHLYTNKFNLGEDKYFNKTNEFAEKYEQLFLGDGKEVTINTNYTKREILLRRLY